MTYLRVSITDRCDLRCAYCRPTRAFRELPREDLLSHEEFAAVIGIAAGVGVKKVRITGGEPLGKANVAWLLERVAAIPGLKDLGITTNGVRLKAFVPVLAGLGFRVNVHLDTLDPDRYLEVCGLGSPEPVVEGIHAAVEAGIPLKINAVVLPDTSVQDALRLARFGMEVGAGVRFIEAMPVGGANPDEAAREAARILETGLIEALDLAPVGRDGVARIHAAPGATARIGFITPSHPGFCDGCRKLRISCRGMLRTCLFAGSGSDLRAPLRAGATDTVRNLVTAALARKDCGIGREGRDVSTMIGIGG